jgi:hypothetical protein
LRNDRLRCGYAKDNLVHLAEYNPTAAWHRRLPLILILARERRAQWQWLSVIAAGATEKLRRIAASPAPTTESRTAESTCICPSGAHRPMIVRLWPALGKQIRPARTR